MKNINEYSVVVLASNNVWSFTNDLVNSLGNIKYHKLIIGDAGLLPEQMRTLKQHGAIIVDLPHKEHDTNIPGGKDKRYHMIIRQRAEFLQQAYCLVGGPLLQLDADTIVMNDNFDHLDKSKDVTLTVRHMPIKDNVLGLDDPQYPNCGVIFWNNPKNCLEFWQALHNSWKNTDLDNKMQPEQTHFYPLLQSNIAKAMSWQKLHCRYYNCYNPDWINKDTSIIHYKGKPLLGERLLHKWTLLKR